MTPGPSRHASERGTHVESGHVRELDVEEDEIGPELPHGLERRDAVGGLAHDVEPLGLEHRTGRRPEARMVVDDQHGAGHMRSSQTTVAAQ